MGREHSKKVHRAADSHAGLGEVGLEAAESGVVWVISNPPISSSSGRVTRLSSFSVAETGEMGVEGDSWVTSIVGGKHESICKRRCVVHYTRCYNQDRI